MMRNVRAQYLGGQGESHKPRAKRTEHFKDRFLISVGHRPRGGCLSAHHVLSDPKWGNWRQISWPVNAIVTEAIRNSLCKPGSFPISIPSGEMFPSLKASQSSCLQIKKYEVKPNKTKLRSRCLSYCLVVEVWDEIQRPLLCETSFSAYRCHGQRASRDLFWNWLCLLTLLPVN